MSGNLLHLKTLGELKKAGYRFKPIKQEIRDNLISALSKKKEIFTGIKGYEETVLPQVQTALLARHNIIFLGLRGQAKTRIARMMTDLLDDYVPVVEGSEIHDDPFFPFSAYGRDLVAMKGDATPITWISREERYTEKLATPDVSVADLIGDLDPIKAAAMKLSYADERVIHFGLIPRSHRGIFVINELPDLQPRIQVSLFNILQEGDIQIRGFKLRLPLDIQFVFTANPEDYTNRGSIVTPLKDRIESQILTHYPQTVDISREITEQEADLLKEQTEAVTINDLLKELVEQIAFEARESEYVDQKSGVSARLTISAYENLIGEAERRMLINKEKKAFGRISDLYAIIPAITGKVELVYEGEVEGIANVAYYLIGKAIRKKFESLFPSPEKIKKKKEKNNPYQQIVVWFSEGNYLDIMRDMPVQEYQKMLANVPGLESLIKNYISTNDPSARFLYMEFALHGLAEFSQLSKHKLEKGIQFEDLMSSMFNNLSGTEEEADEDLF